MENNFDNKIKNNLENYELPYDSAAWTKLNKKLDQSMPVQVKPNYKLWVAASIVFVTTISSVYLLSNNSTENITERNSEKELTTISKNALEEKSTDNLKNQPISPVSDVPKNINVTESEIKAIPQVDKTTGNSNGNINFTPTIAETPIQLNSQQNNITPKTELKIVVPKLSNVCQGETFQIKNQNNIDLVIIGPSNKKTISRPRTNLNYILNIPGEYEVGYEKEGAFYTVDKFIVQSAPKANFEIDNEYKYNEKGLPSISLKANSSATLYDWNFDKHSYSPETKEIEVHYFNAGTYKITLTTTSENGCKSSETNKVTIAEDYNLMAQNSINTSDVNSKNKTFMPYALTVRNVKFTLTILDPKNGGIIYQTDDASQPWDGIDVRTGNFVPQDQNCIWKVNINTPEPGERANYKGVIIRL